MFLARPNTFNRSGEQIFPTISEAIAYLEEVTGYAMGFHKTKKQGIVYDWELVGKLIRL